MILSYKFRIYPNRVQRSALDDMLVDFCDLYNAGLEQRIEAWRRRRVSVNYFMQRRELKATRAVHEGLTRWSFSAEEEVLRRLDKTFKAFFTRLKRGDKPGFPRFRTRTRYHSAEFRVGGGLTLRKSGRIGFVGVPGEVKVKWHRQLPSAPKSAILTRKCGKWYIIFHVEVESQECVSSDSIGIDFGLSNLIALSNGQTVPRPNWTKRAARELRRRRRALARCKPGSKISAKRKAALAKFYAHVAAKRRDHLHKISRDLVDRFGRIAIEDLNVKGLASGMLAKDVHDASWGQLIAMLEYKAERAGAELVKVDPRGTSQTCPQCGTIRAKTLAEREHRCDCGCRLDRDVAAAMVVHHRAFGFWPGTGLGALSEPVAVKLAPEAACGSGWGVH